ncbi:MAG: UDP-N-acetylmuramate--L-alanine ligase [Bacteroidales bacterium]|nr:UDP-N-acetylmuramate--L-alanine ligase [Bacteroidales bacterium]
MKNVYLLGIGGIGMSAIARYYNAKGYKVSGYDKVASKLTAELESEGITIHYEDRPDLMPDAKDTFLVVYTPAIAPEVKELQKALGGEYKTIKRGFALGEIAKDQKCIAISGSHGKTTTSTLTAYIIQESGMGCNAFLGGISKNYNSNLFLSPTKTIVAEADEFDRAFLQLFPSIAVITYMDADHLDVFGDIEHLVEAFKAFASQVSDFLIVKKGLDITSKDTKAKIYTYATDDPEADFHAENIRKDECGYFIYDLASPFGPIKDIKVGVIGKTNIENSIAAAASCLCHGVPKDAIRSAIGSFKGAKRRFDIHLNTPHLTYIDDYGHHPEEISSAIKSIKEVFEGRKLTAIFQPALYTRTRDFYKDFAKSLSKADALILLDVYGSREKPIPGISSEIIFENVTIDDKVLIRKEELLDYLCKLDDIDVLVTFGSGNISNFADPITKLLEERL